MTRSTIERGDSVAPDAVLTAVANERRRVVLRVLDQTDEGAMAFDTLVDRVAERVRTDDGELPADEHRQRVRTTLHHVHLPKLEASGMIVHDTETKQVRNVTGALGRELLTVVEPYETRD